MMAKYEVPPHVLLFRLELRANVRSFTFLTFMLSISKKPSALVLTVWVRKSVTFRVSAYESAVNLTRRVESTIFLVSGFQQTRAD